MYFIKNNNNNNNSIIAMNLRIALMYTIVSTALITQQKPTKQRQYTTHNY